MIRGGPNSSNGLSESVSTMIMCARAAPYCGLIIKWCINACIGKTTRVPSHFLSHVDAGAEDWSPPYERDDFVQHIWASGGATFLSIFFIFFLNVKAFFFIATFLSTIVKSVPTAKSSYSSPDTRLVNPQKWFWFGWAVSPYDQFLTLTHRHLRNLTPLFIIYLIYLCIRELVWL